MTRLAPTTSPSGAAPADPDPVRVGDGGLSVSIDPQGAQLRSIRTPDGLEHLWQGDPRFWPDRAPVLFPLICQLTGGQLVHRGERYPMPAHGFAHLRRFAVVDRAPTRVRLELAADDQTRAQYPFEFVLGVILSVEGGRLQLTLEVHNAGDEPMPADVGFHPGFNWPLQPGRAKEDYRIVFEAPEPAPIRRGVDDPIFLEPEPFPTPVEGDTLPLRDELWDAQAMVFDELASRSLVYGPPGGRGLRIAFPDSPYLALWMRPGAPYLCIEPWQGLPAPVGFAGEFATKPGVGIVGPGVTRRWRLLVEPLTET